MANLPVILKLDSELNEKLLQDYKGERTGFVQIGTEKWFLPIKYEKICHELLNFEVRPDDTWVVTFPRSGTTVISELAWLLANNMDFDTAKKVPSAVRIPYLDMDLLIHADVVNELRQENESEGRTLPDIVDEPNWKTLHSAPSPRFIKSHLPIQLLPKNLLTSGAKIIYIARNPKDVAVSYYHMYRMVRFHSFTENLSTFWNLFQKNLTIYSPYWDHVIGGWNNRHYPNFQFVFYEEFNKNPMDVILKMAKFFNKNLSEDQIAKLVEHLKFENFKTNESVNHNILAAIKVFTITPEESFIRKGKVGGWVDEFTENISAEADKWIEENLKRTDLCFPF